MSNLNPNPNPNPNPSVSGAGGGSGNRRAEFRGNNRATNVLTPFSASLSSNGVVSADVDISNQQVAVSSFSIDQYATREREGELITIIHQLNELITRNQLQINRINSQLRVPETGLAATNVDVRSLAQNVAAYTAMSVYYGQLLNNIQRQIQERDIRTLSAPVLNEIDNSRRIIVEIEQIFETLGTRNIANLTTAEWQELKQVIENFIKGKQNKKLIKQQLQSFWETVRDTSIDRSSSALAGARNVVSTYGPAATVGYGSFTLFQTMRVMTNMGNNVVTYVEPTTPLTADLMTRIMGGLPDAFSSTLSFFQRGQAYVVRFMAGGATIVITNPSMSLLVVSLLAMYHTLPAYAQQQIRSTIIYLLRLIFIQTPYLGYRVVLMIYTSIVVPLWNLLGWLVGAPGQIVMALFNLFPSHRDMNLTDIGQWITGMWSYITNNSMVRLAGSMITGSSSSSRSSSNEAAQRVQLAANLTSPSAANLTPPSAEIPNSPSSNSNNAASSNNAETIIQQARNPDQEYTVTVSSVGTNGQETPIPNLRFTASSEENNAANTAIQTTVESLNENSTPDAVNTATTIITNNLNTTQSDPTPQQIADTTTTAVNAVFEAEDNKTANRIETVSRDNTPANSQVLGEEPVSPQNAIIAEAALSVINDYKKKDIQKHRRDINKDAIAQIDVKSSPHQKLVGRIKDFLPQEEKANTQYVFRDDDPSETSGDEGDEGDEEEAGTPRGPKTPRGSSGGRRKSRRRRTRSTKKRSIRRRRGTKRRGTRKRQRRYTKRRR